MKKYVLVGCGHRGIHSYAVPLVNEYEDCAELCGVYDINHKRAEVVSEFAGKNIPVFDDFDEMLKTVKPDTVIVTPKDCAHDDYILKALYAGCDVISEKPLTTTFEKALRINKAQEETGKNVIVTFNLRFHPFFKRIKEIVKSGTIGKILSVHYEWMLDTSHGADYFRRWHRERENSGSLLVHKSTHHFDLVNWFLEEDPMEVMAFGSRRFYGETRENRSLRCTGCPHKETCEFYLDIDKDPFLKKIYRNCEDVDGYYRDKCVFSDEINIEDSVSVNVRYSGGAIMSYSLTAHSPYEGLNLVLNGTDGRIEIKQNGLATALNYDAKTSNSLVIYNRKGEIIDMMIPQTTAGGHGGADSELRDRLFRYPDLSDPISQMAGLRAGMMSIGIGMAANISMAEDRNVKLSEFYDELSK
ncbi:MAG: Gfo/Idh/MocA family oxidoreductase [Clostridia bacterium]|nr:Gfo/Idh/MocA family oxidoreductase [Clostridia bacterium]